MSTQPFDERLYGTVEAARVVGIHVNTLKKWLRNEWVTPPRRLNNYRFIFTDSDIVKLIEFKEKHPERERRRLKRLHKFNHTSAVKRALAIGTRL